MTIEIKAFFEKQTSTCSYIIFDKKSLNAVIIDPVLGFDIFSGRTNTAFADQIIYYIQKNNLTLKYILETHIHADHLSAASYIKGKIGGRITISESIKNVLGHWAPIFSIEENFLNAENTFDKLAKDNDELLLGNNIIKVISTPGHTATCVSYKIENNLFCGDSLFMPDIGTARTDFPGGSAAMLFDSIQKIYNLPCHTNIYVGHDYPPEERSQKFFTTVEEHQKNNVLINKKTTKNNFITLRNKRDQNKPIPKLLIPSIQYNLRCGSFGEKHHNNQQFIKIPINTI